MKCCFSRTIACRKDRFFCTVNSMQKFLFPLLLAAGYIYNRQQTRKLKVRSLKFPSEKMREDLRFTHITDYHGNPYVDVTAVLESIEEHGSSFIVLTGDMADFRKPESIPVSLELIRRLSTLEIPMYFVYGNHDQAGEYQKYYTDSLRETGVRILYNESETLSVGKNTLRLVGITEEDPDYEKATKNVAPEDVTMVLCHKPDRILEMRNETEDFIFCGHTHGGQVRFPWIGALWAPGQGLFPKYSKGRYNIGKTVLYIDSGVGNSRKNLRAFNPIQFTNVTITCTNSSIG
jgi:predicted MPP superfamily phosphohydrolase